MAVEKQQCPNCSRLVQWLFSDWDNPINNGWENVCEYCASEEGVEKSKSLKELNEEREKESKKKQREIDSPPLIKTKLLYPQAKKMSQRWLDKGYV